MFRKIGRFVLVFLTLLLLLGAIVAGFGPLAVQRLAVRSFPEVDGRLEIEGLDAPVDIYRDAYGIPHIYASTQHDVFFAQGYVHAQDRFWQMDFWRHQGAGRLSELLGKATLSEDRFLRTLGWERVARQEWETLADRPRSILLAYSEGVNAYLKDHHGVELSLEYAFLPLVNRGYQPAPWTPLNSLTWAKAMAWDLRGNMDEEIERALLLNSLSPEQVQDLYPPYPEKHPLIVSDRGESEASPALDNHLTALADLSRSEQQGMLRLVQEAARDLDARRGGGFPGIGSNSWAVSGDLTETGMPFLANDPHLGVQMPSIWYQNGLHCAPKTEECPLDLVGFSFAGTPGVVIGHNDRIAWGLTNVGPDVMDLYIEKIHPDHPNQYLYRGKWVDMEILTETIQVAGQEPVDLEVRLTRHGPLITDVYGLDDFHEEAGLDLPENYALALRWTALEPSCVFCAIWKMNTARNWREFRSAARDFAVPSQNLIYADGEGNIGYQMPGRIPIRQEGHTGLLPVPGWTGAHEWQGYIPFDDLPSAFNPAQGYIVTANNAVVGSSYPYLITHQWDYGYRAQRLAELIEQGKGQLSMDTMRAMQADSKDLLAEELIPILLDAIRDDPDLTEVREMLADWDCHFRPDSAPALLYSAFWRSLVEEVYADDLPEGHQVGVDSRAMELIRGLLSDPEDFWWDDQSTENREDRDEILRRALARALDEVENRQGREAANWGWGKEHTVTFENQVMSSFPFINQAFNRGPYPAGGGNSLVNAAGWSAEEPYVVDWLPSLRMIVDLGDLAKSRAAHTTGQSGHAYHPHYVDMVPLWQNIQHYGMLWTREEVQNQAEAHLQLLPAP